MPLVGGLQATQLSDDFLQELLDKILPQVQQQVVRDEKITRLEGHSFRTQLVNGVNYWVKAKVIPDSNPVEYLHLRIHRPFGENSVPSLHSYQSDKKEEDFLDSF